MERTFRRQLRVVAPLLALAASTLSLACGSSPANAPPQTLPSVTIPLEPTPPVEEQPAPPPAAQKKAAPEYAPDPEPLRMADQYELSFRYERGEVKLSNVAKRTFAQPLSTERRLGRFALELWIGHELIERVRFDFPLLAAPARDDSDKNAASIEAGLTVTQKVLVPADQRATRAILVDRATGEQRELAWPPSDSATAAPPLPAPAQVPTAVPAPAPAPAPAAPAP